jgi:hypothetical protein
VQHADREWLAAVQSGHPSGHFGHREHLRLSWLSLEAADTVEAASHQVSSAIQRIAATHGAPRKFNHTVTQAWVRIVAHVRSAYGVRTFDELLEAGPWLFDKRLLLQHYTARTLASARARHSFVPPDVSPIPD